MFFRYMLNTNINIMTNEAIFVTQRGGPVRLFGLPWGFSPSREGSRQKEISDPPHPLRWKNRSSKSWKIDFFEKNFEKILKVQKFLWSRSGRNFCRHSRISKVSIIQVFNPGKIHAKLAKLWSSEDMMLLNKSLVLSPPGDYLL